MNQKYKTGCHGLASVAHPVPTNPTTLLALSWGVVRRFDFVAREPPPKADQTKPKTKQNKTKQNKTKQSKKNKNKKKKKTKATQHKDRTRSATVLEGGVKSIGSSGSGALEEAVQ